MNMKIGEFSGKAGVKVQTIRFYERQKLLPPPPRTVSGYRSYSQADLEKVIFIKRSQQLGFTLKEIKELIALHASISKISKRKGGKSRESQQFLSIAGGKIAQLDDKLSMLRAVKRQLLAMLTEIETSADICPVSKKTPRKYISTA